MAEDDSRLSKSKEKSEVGDNTKKVFDKTSAMKDTCLAAEGMEK